jgi:hypothetical protein
MQSMQRRMVVGRRLPNECSEGPGVLLPEQIFLFRNRLYIPSFFPIK